MKSITRVLDFQPSYDLGSICSPEEMLLFDIETTGLSKERTQMYLIGCAFTDRNHWYIRQWLTQNTGDERIVLEEFLQMVSGYRVLVTFNGERFDIPYISYKSSYYGIEDFLNNRETFDIYANVRKIRKLLQLPSLSQKSLECFLGIQREDQLDGGRLIPVYYEYEKRGTRELEDLLLLHNFDDLQGMLRILPVLSYTRLLQKEYQFSGFREDGDFGVFDYILKNPVPVPVSAELTLPAATEGQKLLLTAELAKESFRIRIPIRKGTFVLPLNPVSDYYYLPEKDLVIHKDVAQFVDRSHRIKATKKNCFIKKEGWFLPQISSLAEPGFYLPEDQKQSYADLDLLRQITDPQKFCEMAHEILLRICA